MGWGEVVLSAAQLRRGDAMSRASSSISGEAGRRKLRWRRLLGRSQTGGIVLLAGLTLAVVTGTVAAAVGFASGPQAGTTAGASRLGDPCRFARGLPTRTVGFRASDGMRLRGTIFGEGRYGLVVAGATSDNLCEWIARDTRLIRLLTGNGFRVLVFARRQQTRGSAGYIADVRGAAAVLRRSGARRLVLMGESVGGLLAVAAAGSIRPSPAAVISVSGSSASAPGATDANFVSSAEAGAKRLRTPLLLIAGKGDKTSVANARYLFEAASRADKRLLIIPGRLPTGSLLVPSGSPHARRVEGGIFDFVQERVVLPPPATRGIAISRLGSSYSRTQNYDRYGYVIVGVGDATAAGTLSTKSLVYMSGTSVQPRFFTGVTYDEARSENWLLKDSAGNYLMNEQYEARIADIGNPAYQKRWANNVARFLSRHGNDGVFIDDVVVDVGQLTDNTYPAEYPTPQAWQNAELSFIRYVGRALKSQGFYVLASASGRIRGDVRSDSAELTKRFWRSLAPFVSGLYSEYWLQLPTDSSTLRAAGSANWQQWWGQWQSLVGVAQSANVDFFAEMYGTSASTSVMRYGRASFLLDWDGKGGAFLYIPDEGTTDPWNPEWTLEVGRPARRKYRVGVGWRRDYTAGVTLVNPSPTTPQTFSLDGTYYRPDGTAVTSVTLDPTSAVILRR
jgi:putative glycosyl hydrolase-like family 15 (GHL15) protein